MSEKTPPLDWRNYFKLDKNMPPEHRAIMEEMLTFEYGLNNTDGQKTLVAIAQKYPDGITVTTDHIEDITESQAFDTPNAITNTAGINISFENLKKLYCVMENKNAQGETIGYVIFPNALNRVFKHEADHLISYFPAVERESQALDINYEEYNAKDRALNVLYKICNKWIIQHEAEKDIPKQIKLVTEAISTDVPSERQENYIRAAEKLILNASENNLTASEYIRNQRRKNRIEDFEKEKKFLQLLSDENTESEKRATREETLPNGYRRTTYDHMVETTKPLLQPIYMNSSCTTYEAAIDRYNQQHPNTKITVEYVDIKDVTLTKTSRGVIHNFNLTKFDTMPIGLDTRDPDARSEFLANIEKLDDWHLNKNPAKNIGKNSEYQAMTEIRDKTNRYLQYASMSSEKELTPQGIKDIQEALDAIVDVLKAPGNQLQTKEFNNSIVKLSRVVSTYDSQTGKEITQFQRK